MNDVIIQITKLCPASLFLSSTVCDATSSPLSPTAVLPLIAFFMGFQISTTPPYTDTFTLKPLYTVNNPSTYTIMNVRIRAHIEHFQNTIKSLLVSNLISYNYVLRLSTRTDSRAHTYPYLLTQSAQLIRHFEAY